ncbi:uncharacterized protein A4U43_C08F22010 [Asparagus officinalis]|uniref:uncharacterized protein LOC109821452 n=1 Tax=Asparagus officinalis TaxID=4686 RepID=UPI00098DEB15|nr:uncharacterized protein LOC109821452 [Asparagus officinalis]ONK60735.1 uncharacterized protein A4U43_C08F22010 [Asparagus officinalis]
MASLALIQGYSSAEDEEERRHLADSDDYDSERSDDDDSDDEAKTPRSRRRKKSPPQPPEFLNNAVGCGDRREEAEDVDLRGRRGRARREKKNLPAVVVVEAKAQLVGIRDRVRSDIEGSSPAPATVDTAGDGKRVITASNPEPKDAADLLRMCLQCGVPKTYSHNRGMVCPLCGDRPPADPLKESEKKKGSTIKDKEKNKRMKGQSSHATWKSETEMQLRQQFD